jgi:hypothetical protein
MTLYHGTRRQHLASILATGLQPGALGLVWATESREAAQRFAEGLDYPAPTPDAVVVAIEAPRSAFAFERPLTRGRADAPGSRVARFPGRVAPEWIRTLT